MNGPKEIRLTKISDIAEGAVKAYAIDDNRKVALTRVGNTFYAFEDRCTHDDGELASGHMADANSIECPRHGARFDVKTGKATRMPAVYPIEIYPVEVRNGEVWIKIPTSVTVEEQ